jgi:AbrB family looped-hinge helix DNA binding protein
LVIPKSLRDRLGLSGGRSVEIREREGRIEIEPRSTPMTLVKSARGPVAIPAEKLPPLTDEIVRSTLDKTRR